ncbi:MAG TPA: diguanylate cyclase, partial [Candidatus Tenderia sp.]|nr:diguanylate cyclase [Candidatus Tenderia sp.]
SKIEALNLPHEFSSTADHITISLGVATMVPTADKKAEDLIEAADQALYEAKESGRNRYHLAA